MDVEAMEIDKLCKDYRSHISAVACIPAEAIEQSEQEHNSERNSKRDAEPNDDQYSCPH